MTIMKRNRGEIPVSRTMLPIVFSKRLENTERTYVKCQLSNSSNSTTRNCLSSTVIETVRLVLCTQAKERWNFDFEKEEPLPGRYVWVKLDQHGNEIRNPLEANSRVENIQTMQEEDAQDDDVTMQDHAEDKDDDKMTDST